MDDVHIKTINSLALKLELQNKEEIKTIYQRQKELNERCVKKSILGPKGMKKGLVKVTECICQIGIEMSLLLGGRERGRK